MCLFIYFAYILYIYIYIYMAWYSIVYSSQFSYELALNVEAEGWLWFDQKGNIEKRKQGPPRSSKKGKETSIIIILIIKH